jgi:tetratricopeptide (TPR) repeat protein
MQAVIDLIRFKRINPHLAGVMLVCLIVGHGNSSAADGLPKGVLGRTEPLVNPVLLGYYESFLESQDIDTFLQNILARYNDSTLLRLLESSQVEARRASVLALGLMGGPQCNGPVAARMKDSDPVVRRFAENALWGIWFRSDSPANNEELTAVRNLLTEERFEEAMIRVNALIAKAPQFAEAWNQRAILHFTRGDLQKSVDDCREVVKRNPYHFGAMSGMAQSLMKLGKPNEALDVFKTQIKIQPHNEAVQAAIDSLERGRL